MYCFATLVIPFKAQSLMIKLFKTIEPLQAYLNQERVAGKTIGFVATMGALHNGHMHLVKKGKEENDILICSVFVNPTQFTNHGDLENYPRNLEEDIMILEKEECDAVFAPSVEVMYPHGMVLMDMDLDGLDKVMEGKYRPGHFQGMITIVYKLLEIVKPHRAYFGEKDFQQLAIIKFMVHEKNIPTEIVGCRIIREKDGLALSSRNIHLTKEERAKAPVIYSTLKAAVEKINLLSPLQLQQWIKEQIEKTGFFKVEYVSFINSETLKEVSDWNGTDNRACIAVQAAQTRLIDNIPLPRSN